ncbi:Snf7 family protein [Xylariomycetidae sp. FL0641]|nr:Snf7 family protein [Xylariomycetidae sp. FL0641]
METIKSLFVKPDPNAQMRKCNQLIRSNIRKVDRDLANLKQVETKTKNLIVAADRRAQRQPAQRAQAQREARLFARELLRTRRAAQRLATSRAQLGSVQLQVGEAFAVRRIEGGLRTSAGVLRDLNALVRLPQLAGTMQELGVELMKAGVIEEMTAEILPGGEVEYEDEEADLENEADEEVDKVLGEILKGKMDKAGPAPAAPVAPQEPAEPVVEAEDPDQDDVMDQMRNRLEALKS